MYILHSHSSIVVGTGTGLGLFGPDLFGATNQPSFNTNPAPKSLAIHQSQSPYTVLPGGGFPWIRVNKLLFPWTVADVSSRCWSVHFGVDLNFPHTVSLHRSCRVPEPLGFAPAWELNYASPFPCTMARTRGGMSIQFSTARHVFKLFYFPPMD